MKIKFIGIYIAISSLVLGIDIIHINSNRIFTLNKKELNKFSIDIKEENYLTIKIRHPMCRASIMAQDGRQIGKTNRSSGDFNERVPKGKYYITIHPNSFCRKIEIFTPEFTRSKTKKRKNIIIITDKKDAKINYKEKYEECMKSKKK